MHIGNQDVLTSETKHDWTRPEVGGLFGRPFADLIFAAQTVHRKHFDANQVQRSTLLSIKTGGCPEDCAYCSQSVHFETGLEATKLAEVNEVIAGARKAKEAGASRFCMGAAWRNPRDRDMGALCEMVEGVRELGMETCMTLGMLTDGQVGLLKDAGLDFYNHNVDTSESYYSKIITTRAYRDRLETLDRVRTTGIKVCSGGIVGMGENEADRADMLITLANLSEHPESVPINALMPVEGTPLSASAPIDPIDFVRTVAVARLMMPKSVVRLSAGREHMSDETQALCFLAGANSIFIGDRLLTTKNPEPDTDELLFSKLGIEPMPVHAAG